MPRTPEAISTLTQLLESMTVERDSRKTHAVLYRRPDGMFVREHFDDGKGHSNAFTSERRQVGEELYETALARGLVSGVLKPGYVSRDEFVITEDGKKMHYRIKRLREEALKQLPPTKAMRVCDLQLFFPDAAEEELTAALEESVRRGHAEKHEQQAQVFYLRKLPAMAG